MASPYGFTHLDMLEDDTESVISSYGEESSAATESEEVIQSVGSFTCFPKLPAEIRLKIWKNFLPGPRIMRMVIKFEARQPYIEGQKRKPRVSRFVASHPPPIGLWVCRETRIEVLKEYELAFPTKTTSAQTYINYKLDTLFLDTLTNYFPHTKDGTVNNSTAKTRKKKSVILHKEFSKVRFHVIDERGVWFNDRLFTTTHFPCLETISLLVYGQSISLLNSRSWDIEECEGPKEPDRTLQTIQWSNNWVNRMESLAKKNANHPQPRIRFVHLIEGSGQREAKGKIPDSEEGAKAVAKGVA